MIIGIGQVPDPELPAVSEDIVSTGGRSNLSVVAEDCVHRAVLWDRCRSGDVAYISPPPITAEVIRPGYVKVKDPRRDPPFPAGVPVYQCEEIVHIYPDKSQISSCREVRRQLDEVYPKWMPERAQALREIIDGAGRGYKRARGKSPSASDLATYLALMVPAEEAAGIVPGKIPGDDKGPIRYDQPGHVGRPAEGVPAWVWLVGGGVVLYLLLSRGGKSK